MDAKQRFGTLIQTAGKAARDALDNAVQAVDQNGDGKLNLTDASVIAGSVGDAVRKGTQAVVDSAGEKARLLELKNLRPIFSETLDSADFFMPKLIRITERDKKHAESAVCQGSIGFVSEQKGFPVVNIFRDSVEAFGLTFYPDYDCEFYYVDPSDRDHYIALDEYFSHLKVERINELQKIAQDLGAKYFKVTYKEEKTSFAEKRAKAGAAAGAAKTSADHESEEKQYSMVNVEAEMEFPGHAPVKPHLKYMQRDTSIQTLVAMRMNETTPLMHQRFMLQMSHSAGIKENDAVKIDAVLKGLKYSGNATVAGEVKNESRRYLEYEIAF